MANQAITDLDATTAPTSADLIEIVQDVSTTPVNKKITIDTLNSLFTNNSLARQAIINGNFDVAQRGDTIAPIDVTQTYPSDHWAEYPSKDGGTLPTLTRTRETLTSGDIAQSFYYTRLTTDGAGSGFGNNSYHRLAQRIENGVQYLCGDGKKVTVSFYARSSVANKKLAISIAQNYGTGGTPSATEYITPQIQTLTSSWVKYSFTFTTNTLAEKTFGTTNTTSYLYLVFLYQWGSTNPFGATGSETYVGSGTTDITQVQLCAGDVALPFMPKSFGEELRACQRYYEVSFEPTETVTTFGQTGRWVHPMSSIAANTVVRAPIFWKVTKRAIPTVHTYGPVARTVDKVHCYDGTDREVTATIAEQGRGGARLDFTTPNNAGAATIFASYHWTSESEL